MKKLIFAVAGVLTALGVGTARAASGDTRVVIERHEYEPRIEAGVQAGFPTGFTFKYWLDRRNAVDLAVARNFSTTGYSGNLDYLIHTRSFTGPESEVKVPVYLGAGARMIRFDDGDTAIGPRMPFGIEAMMTRLPLAFFAEVAPTVELGAGDPTVTADAAVGGRLVF